MCGTVFAIKTPGKAPKKRETIVDKNGQSVIIQTVCGTLLRDLLWGARANDAEVVEHSNYENFEFDEDDWRSSVRNSPRRHAGTGDNRV